MTSTVTVKAHPAEGVEVIVATTQDGQVVSLDILQDGETIDKTVYGNQSVVVTEEAKKTEEAPAAE